MSYKNLSEFLDVLEPPLQIPKPNKFKIIHMDIPIVRYTNMENETSDNMVFCADILDALTQDFFARKGNPIEEPPHVDEIKVGARFPGFYTLCAFFSPAQPTHFFDAKIILFSLARYSS